MSTMTGISEIEFLIRELKATYPVFSGFNEADYNKATFNPSTTHAESDELFGDIIDISVEGSF